MVLELDAYATAVGVVSVVRGGSVADPVGAEGVAHLVEHLTFRAVDTSQGSALPLAALSSAKSRRTSRRERLMRYAASETNGLTSPDATVMDGGDDEFDEADGRDFGLDLARDLLAHAQAPNRRELLDGAKAVFDRTRAEEDRRLVAAMKKLGVDWSPGSSTSVGGRVELEIAAVDSEPTAAGASLRIRGRVKNVGATNLHRVYAVLSATNPFFDGKEIVFGTLAPGETKAAEVAVRISPDALSQADAITARLSADEPVRANDGHFIAKVRGKARPVFAFSYETLTVPTQARGAEPVGSPRLGIAVKIRNLGAGPSPAMTASLRNAQGQQGVLIDAGLFRVRQMPPGATERLSFVYEVVGHPDNEYRFDLTIGDTELGLSTTHRISFEKGGTGAASGHVTPPMVNASTPLLETAATVHLTGTASCEGGLRDVFVSVESAERKWLRHKVFYMASPGNQAEVPFVVDVPLEFGSNFIRVTARGADGVATTTPLVVLRPHS